MTDAAPSPSTRSAETPFESVAPVAQPLDVSQDRQWATLAHLGGVVGVLPSYMIHRVFKDRGPFTAQESREAANYTMLPTLVILAGIVLVASPISSLATLVWIAGVFLLVTGIVEIIRAMQLRRRARSL